MVVVVIVVVEGVVVVVIVVVVVVGVVVVVIVVVVVVVVVVGVVVVVVIVVVVVVVVVVVIVVVVVVVAAACFIIDFCFNNFIVWEYNEKRRTSCAERSGHDEQFAGAGRGSAGGRARRHHADNGEETHGDGGRAAHPRVAVLHDARRQTTGHRRSR